MALSTRTKVAAGGGISGAALLVAVTIISQFDGLRTWAYRDAIGVRTICYGHTQGVKMGDSFTKAQCKEMLSVDLQKYNAMMEKCIKVKMPPSRHAAMVSFTYNVGQGNVCKSSVARHMNAGRVTQACNSLLQWNRAGGRVLKGLTTRRQAERKLCLRND